MKDLSPLLLLILGLLALGAILAATIFKWTADEFDVIDPVNHYPKLGSCDANHFVEEFGSFNPYYTTTKLEFDGSNYFILPFDSNFVAVVKPENGLCKFVLDEPISHNVFESYIHNSRVVDFDKNFYRLFTRCNREDAGADRFCKLTTKITKTIDSNVITISAAVPEEVIREVEEKAKKEGFELVGSVASGWIRLSKKFVAFSNTEYFLVIELTKQVSCASVDPIDLGIFKNSNESQQIFYDAKNRVYSSGSVSYLNNANLAISLLVQLNEFNLVEQFTNYFTGDAICNEEDKTDFKGNIQRMLSATDGIEESASSLNEKYRATLADLQKPANRQMEIESSIKQSGMFKFENVFKIWSWIAYVFHDSGSDEAFDLGHYKESKEKALVGTMHYNFYWERTSWVDNVPAVFVILLIIGLIIWVVRQPPEMPTAGIY